MIERELQRTTTARRALALCLRTVPTCCLSTSGNHSTNPLVVGPRPDSRLAPRVESARPQTICQGIESGRASRLKRPAWLQNREMTESAVWNVHVSPGCSANLARASHRSLARPAQRLSPKPESTILATKGGCLPPLSSLQAQYGSRRPSRTVRRGWFVRKPSNHLSVFQAGASMRRIGPELIGRLCRGAVWTLAGALGDSVQRSCSMPPSSPLESLPAPCRIRLRTSTGAPFDRCWTKNPINLSIKRYIVVRVSTFGSAYSMDFSY